MKHFYPSLLLVTVASLAAAQQWNSAPPSSFQSNAPQFQAQTGSPQGRDQVPDPLLDPPPLPKGKVSLIGGTVKAIDRVRNKLVVQVFGGPAMKMSFDERSHFYRDGVETTQMGVSKGDRVYVDTMLDGTSVLARNVRVETGVHAADTSGQIISMDSREGTITILDRLSAQPVTVQLGQKTTVLREKTPVSVAAITPGSMVAVKFAPERANRGIAQEILIIASPGMRFTFAGKVTNIDLRTRMFSVENQTDKKTYDLRFSPALVDKRDAFGIGSQVTVVATFVGSGYRADSITVTASPPAASAN